MRLPGIALALLLPALLMGCEGKAPSASAAQTDVPHALRVAGQTMGTYYAVTLPGGFPGGEEALRELSERTFKKVVDAISTFDERSELSMLNARASTDPQGISDFLAGIIEGTLKEERRIGFATDISVGPLVELWGFGKRGRDDAHAPSQEDIDAARALTGPDAFTLTREGGRAMIRKRDPRVRIDLATVGEGIGADLLAGELDRLGIGNYMVAVAGAIRSKGVNERKEPWKVGIEDPTAEDRRVMIPACPLGKALSTAGSYRNYFLDRETGKLYSHAIDPASGYPVDHRTVSVTVIADTALATDALDTGLLVMGADRALEWAEREQVPILAIELDASGKAQIRHSSAFAPYLECGGKSR
ncbi:MAG: FAD:protein FMN transferase [Succinivibrionaceae bacterium]|nr:FAD:protein FMN transferase [Succinivibrionaceae bacterium]